ncbi:MAG: GxxExxY protein [Caldilineaceae bacterium]
MTEQIIGAFYTVYNELGYGFLEKVYENALALEIRKRNLVVKQQQHIKVYYDNIIVGEYFADLLVADRVIVEIKAAENIDDAHLAQLTNYLKATRFEVGLVLNFGPQPQVKRRIFDQQKSIKSI